MPMSFGSVAKKVVATNIVAVDGSGDYTDIQTAINSLPAGGGVVYIKEGTYTISSTITVNKPSVSIVGAGKSTIISTTLDTVLIKLNAADCTIEKLYIKGNNTAAQRIRVFATRCTIKDCWIENLDLGIDIQSGSNHRVSNNYITGCSDEGISMGVAAESSIDESIISGNICVSNTTDGIKVIDGSRNIIAGDLTISNDTGINITSNATDTLVHGNMSYNNSTSAIVDNGTTSTLADNKTP